MAQWFPESDALARQIRRLAQHGALPHAVILSGSGDRAGAARFFAAALLCRQEEGRPCLRCSACRKVLDGIHPDVRLVQDTDRKELSVETVRQLRQDVYIRPNEAERKVYIFADCEQLNERDQNVLLKIVEEGPAYAAFLFCAESASALLPTIRSRCVELKLRGEDEAPVSEDALALCRAFASARISPVVQLTVGWENRRMKREALQQALEDAWQLCAQALLLQCGKAPGTGPAAETSDALQRALRRHQLQQLVECLRQYAGECRYNVGPGHVLGALAARWEAIIR